MESSREAIMDMTQLGFVLGLDNVAVALALGPLALGARRTAWLALLFGAAEALMPLAGSMVHAASGMALAGDAATMVRVAVLATLATTVLGLAWVRRDPAALVGHPAMLVALALLLGLDNFAAGVAGASAGFSFAALAASGLASGALAFAACLASGGAGRLVAPRHAHLASGIVLAALAVAGFV
jgi:putative Mn2+ efflux pump MntP